MEWDIIDHKIKKIIQVYQCSYEICFSWEKGSGSGDTNHTAAKGLFTVDEIIYNMSLLGGKINNKYLVWTIWTENVKRKESNI